MNQNNAVNFYRNWKLSLLVLSVVPVSFLGFIQIQYGWYLEPFERDTINVFDFLELSYQYSILNSGANLPTTVSVIGILSLKFLNIFYYLFFLFHFIAAYYKLKQQTANTLLLLLEWFLISLIFIFIISPENLISYIVSCLLLACDLALIISYWAYNIKTRNEEG
mgnify:CR=1 FL=1